MPLPWPLLSLLSCSRFPALRSEPLDVLARALAERQSQAAGGGLLAGDLVVSSATLCSFAANDDSSSATFGEGGTNG